MSPSEKLPVVVIACMVFQNLLERHLPDHLAGQVSFMDYGLHRVPVNLTWTVQGAIDSVEEPSLIVLGYGLCGNGLNGIKSGQHTLLVPRADDCIAILLGSHKDYIREFEAIPGTYYLSKGWLESGSNPLQEYQEYVQKYGEESAQWVMDQQYQHYERLVLVAHNQEDLEKYRPQALEVAKYCERWGMRYEEILGSEIYVQRLVDLIPVVSERGKDALDRLGEDFVVIPPGGEIRQDQFIR
ncbi:MAG: DUF1638 domain-containing protein [Anaerolineales bacterium]|jgi:hypothetical protein